MMDKNKNDALSKFMSYILRHHPEDIKLELDKEGWVPVSKLVENAKKYGGRDFTAEEVVHVVETNAKQRFALSEDKKIIRANQGHSVEVYLDLLAVKPPEFLYHGTAERFLDSIMKEGLKPMQRHDVHLSFNPKTALSVGQRHGTPIILQVKALEMYEKGHVFKCTVNNVWLTQEVPVEFLECIKSANS